MHERNNIDWKKTDEYQTGKGRNQTYRNSIFEKDDEGRYKIPLIRQRPVLLMGPPGIGKTQIMEQIAEECKIGLVAYTITHHTRQSAVGLPLSKKWNLQAKSIP